jgi:hypothetical protein
VKIILSPIASTYTTTVSVDGLTLTIDGAPIDLSVIPVGGYAEPDDDSPFVGNVTRDAAKIRYYYERSKAEPNQSTDWADYTFEVTKGDVPCPIKWLPVDDTEVEGDNVSDD